jgi:hypothetical protein
MIRYEIETGRRDVSVTVNRAGCAVLALSALAQSRETAVTVTITTNRSASGPLAFAMRRSRAAPSYRRVTRSD